MKKFLTEAFAMNVIIILMLVGLGGYAARDNSVSAFKSTDAIYKAQTDEKVISVMVNVYQGTEYVEKYVELFQKEGVNATFFLGGCWAAKNTETVKLLFDKGFEIGNHGYNHKLHTRLSQEVSRNEIMRTNTLIKEITGKNVTLFAPPSGDVNDAVVSDALYCGCKTIMWSADTIDWRDQDKEKIISRVKRNLAPGVFVLMHPTAATLEALPEIIEYAKQQGYSFITVGEQLKRMSSNQKV